MVNIPSRIQVLIASGVLSVCMAVPAIAQTQNEAQYSRLLQQIQDQKLTLAQKQVFVAGQQDKIAGLNAQLKGIGGTKEAIGPMIDKMVASLGREINADYPFRLQDRLARFNRLKEFVETDGNSVGEKYRRALNVYKIEVNYGQSLESYKGNHPVTPTVRQGDDRYAHDEAGERIISEATGLPVELFDGDYLRYGRTALIYMSKDGSDVLRYDLSAREWATLKSGGSDVRKAIRVSRGEVAPGVVMAPLLPMP